MGLGVEQFAETVGVDARTVGYWGARPDSVPRPAVQRLLDATLAAAPTSAAAAFSLQPGGDHSGHAGYFDATDDFLIDAHALSTQVGADAVELMAEGAADLARTYTARNLLEEYLAAARLRSQTADLIARTHKPAELADLYSTVGQLGALMGSCAFDLGRSGEAGQLVRAAAVYASHAGDASLVAWLAGLRGTLLLWAGRPRQALAAVQRALAVAPAGPPRHRLRHIGARAAALLGDRPQTNEFLQLAQHDLEEPGHDRLADEVGGEFAFDAGRAAACAAAAWLALDDTPGVASHVDRALAHYAAADSDGKMPALGARLDRAAAHLLVGDVAAAAADLSAVYSATSEHRYSLTSRVRLIAERLDPLEGQGASVLREETSNWLGERRLAT